MKHAFTWLLVFALGVRVAIASRSLVMIDRLFVPDDTYYTLSVARSLARGLGPTVDGVVQTSGFQPLLAFLLVPVFWVQQHPDAALRAAVMLLAIVDAVSALLLGKITERVAGRGAGLVAAALWAISPIAIANALGGLETSLALSLSLGLVLASLVARATDAETVPRTWPFLVLGVLAGLCLLARVDTVFLVTLIGLVHLVAKQYRGLAVTVASAAIVVAPWWLYMWTHFGTVVPESGPAVAQIIEVHRAIYLEGFSELAWTAGSLLGPPFVELQFFREALHTRAALASGLLVVIVSLLFVAGMRLLPRRGALSPIAAFSVFAGVIAAFYTFYLPALWFFRRYLAPCHAWLALLCAVAIWKAWERRAELRGAWLAVALVASAGVATATYETARMLWISPSEPPDQRLHGAKGYRHAAQAIWKLLPERGVLGSFQSGALAYYAPPGWTVVNLDGVVDHHARQAASQLKLADYARTRKLTHYADWHFNTDVFQITSAHTAERFAMHRFAEIKSQGEHNFGVYEVEKAK